METSLDTKTRPEALTGANRGIRKDGRGSIVIDINPISPEQCERLRDIFMTMIRSGSLNVRNGSVSLHFDNDGNLMLIDSHSVKWRRRKL